MKIGQILGIEYNNNDEKHIVPFLLLSINEDKALAVQFSSVDGQGNSYYIELKPNDLILDMSQFNGLIAYEDTTIISNQDGVKYVSLPELNYVYSLDLNIIDEDKELVLETLDKQKFTEIIRALQTNGWNNNFQESIDNIELPGLFY
ncbi:hypothetical protein SCHIN_v1c10290 [Spiroplasma chinense]|uniref:Uncharacterized protein n=1 Tax=Spiroplasma chinense TaxID=216932 RepID=A0A5B9Y808_9MOLU|nr:hypothetical protein [Spiroplasma chinense]QEH62222.1 hypothetical protein SCHIN_v1c10290 [Spiroplasma chinense]